MGQLTPRATVRAADGPGPGKPRLEQSTEDYRQAIRQDPSDYVAYNRLGIALLQSGDATGAAAAFAQAVTLQPGFADAHHNMAVAALAEGRLATAIESLRRERELRPNDPIVHFHLGSVLLDSGDRRAAITCLRQAVARRPGFTDAHLKLGLALLAECRPAEAAACFRTAAQLAPDFPGIHTNLGQALQDQGLPDQAIPHYQHALALQPGFLHAHTNQLFCLNYITGEPTAELKQRARHYGALVTRLAQPYDYWPAPVRGQPLRIGLVSGDLREHAVSFFLESLLRAADPARIQFHAFPTVTTADHVTARIKSRCAEWTPIAGMDDHQAAAAIHAAGVQVLIDLSGHTGNNRLPVFAWRPAPVQATWLGYFATTGVAEIDFIVGDPQVTPPAEAGHFTETIWPLARIYFCFAPPEHDVAVSRLPALANGHITFGCFNNFAKLNDAVIALWARILHAVPNSGLLLKAKQTNNPAAVRAMRRRFAAYGIPSSRMLAEAWSGRADYLRAHHQVDIMLDPFPYPGGTTSCEALWMGVPVLTRRGDRFLSHAGETILLNAGLPGWVAADDDDYLAKAVHFASDIPALASLRAGLRSQVLASPLFDAPRFARDFEQAMAGMVAGWQQGRGPSVPPDPHSLALAAIDAGDLATALAHVDEAIAQNPNAAEYHATRGKLLGDAGETEQALACYGHAVALDPTLAVAHHCRGVLLYKLGRVAEAVDAFKAAVEHQPDLIDAYDNLLLCLNYLEDRPPASMRAQAEHFGAIVAAKARPFTTWTYPATSQPLRVGLVSADLCQHPVGFFLEGVLRAADPARIAFVAFPSGTRHDALTARLQPLCAEWCPIHGLDDAAAAALIHQAGVHVLLDLAGHTAGNRLPVFAWRPAPIQAAWLGYFATSGVAAIDAIIGDPHVTPVHEASHVTETVCRLPETYLCFTPPEPAIPVSSLPARGAGHVTFGCFNKLAKINDTVAAVWARVLAAVPASRLLLKADHVADPGAATTLRARFASHGIAPDRVEIGPFVSREAYLASYNEVDIALDPFPYPGGATTCEALWMGVPVLTRRGDRFLSHAGESFLANAGLPDWIASSNDDYVAKAARFASDLDALAALRLRLRDQVLASPLFDAPRFARHFEQALAGLWARWLDAHPNAAYAEAEALYKAGDTEAATRRCNQILAIEPAHAGSHNLLAIFARAAGCHDTALVHAAQAIASNPAVAAYHNTRGAILGDMGRLDDALASINQAAALNPRWAATHQNRGTFLYKLLRIEEAAEAFQTAIDLQPDLLESHDILLFCHHYLAKRPPQALRGLAERYGAMVTSMARKPFTRWAMSQPSQPLRIGIVSGDLCGHPVGFFLQALLHAADPARIVFVAFPATPAEDDLTRRIKPCFTEWRPIHGLGDQAAAGLIHAANIQILLDLSGHTSNHRLPVFAWRPAPLQATWLGYFATTGVAEIDVIIGDPHVTPAAEASHFTETIWPLPETYLCYTPPEYDVPVSALPALTNGHVTFGCFNNLAKINDAVVALWARILHAVPGSRLMLKARQTAEPAMAQAMRRRFAAHGIADERLIVDPWSERAGYLAAHHRVDIMLDPFPYPGGTTTCDALWMGVPVLTRRGDRFLSHAGETFLGNAGLPGWIADGDDDYLARAIRFAADLDGLAALRQRLRAQFLASPMCDAPRFARHFEQAMAGLWARFLSAPHPADRDALFQDALRLHQAGDTGAAADRYRRLLRLDPRHADSHHLLGVIALAARDLPAALGHADQAIACRPTTAEFHATRGTILSDSGQLDQAVASFDQALALNPAFAAAHQNRGIALMRLGRIDDAAAAFASAVAHQPDFADAHYNLGQALVALGTAAAAVPHYARVTELQPGNALAHHNLLFCANYLETQPPGELRRLAEQFGALASRRARPYSAWAARDHGQKLQIGIVSGDLRHHAVSFFLEALLAAADPARLGFIAFPTQPKEDDVTARLKPRFAAWHPIHALDDEAAAALIHASGVHILLDLAGHSKHNRLALFAWRPAPVQAAWLGYFATTGLAEMDYLIGDNTVAPAAEAHHFTETLWRLPGAYLCFTPPAHDIPVSPLPALANGHVTFGCLNNLAKLNHHVLSVWSRLLHAVPGSRLLLMAAQTITPAAVDTLRARAAAAGLPADRLLIRPWASRADYLATYHQIDIALDPFPYPGGTTTCEALWMGVPVLTRKGTRFLSHAGETILGAAGLPDWIAADDDDYVARATRFVSDPAQLAALRASLRARVLASPLFDAPRFARNFEAAMEGIWHHRHGLVPPAAHDALHRGQREAEAGDLPTALASLDRALTLHPTFAEAHDSRGVVLARLGRLDEAHAAFLQAAALAPGSASAHSNLGRAALELGRPGDAIEHLQRALSLLPDVPETHLRLGNAHAAERCWPEAEAAYRAAIAVQPSFTDGHFNLGIVLTEQDRLHEAAAAYRQTIALQPGHAQAHNNLAFILMEQGEVQAAVEHCEIAVAQEPGAPLLLSHLIGAQNYLPDLTPHQRRGQAERFGAAVTALGRPAFTTWCAPLSPHPLRVGIVSPDLRRHPVGYFLESLLRAIDPARLQLLAFPSRAGGDDLTERLKPCFAAWHPIHALDDQAAATLIHGDGVHVLLDLAGHTGGNRLPVFAWRPAPVQATWLGYFATTGVAEMDYIIGDPQVTPAHEASHFTETVWPLPDTYLCFTPPEFDVPVNDLPALANGCITFGCFNHLAKLNDGVLAVWARILHALPGSRLLLKAKQTADPAAIAAISSRFAAHGIDPGRLLTEPPEPRAQYLRAYNRVDIVLDPFPYCGGTTTCEALWMGIPVLTRRGTYLLAHAGETFLTNAGLPAWIAADDDEYVAKAIRFATDLDGLAQLRHRLRAQLLASPLCDAPRFARHLEQALAGMWARWRERNPPPPVDVAPLLAEALALHKSGAASDAAARYRDILAHDPGHPDANHLLARIALDANDLETALAHVDRALATWPLIAEFHNTRGIVLSQLGRVDEAIDSFHQVTQLKPSLALAHRNRAVLLLKQGRTAEAIAGFERAVEHGPAVMEAQHDLQFNSHYLPERTPAQRLEAARRFGAVVTAKARPFTQWDDPVAGAPLRIGIVSPDLRTHPVGFFLEPLLREADRAAIEFVAFSNHSEQDALTLQIKPYCAEWHPIHDLDDQAAAALIHASGVQILIDLAGHSAGNRLPVFAWRPAPVQATWLGYFATTGVAEIDFIIGDPHVTPAAEAGHFTETIWPLPETYLCFAPPDIDVAAGPLPALANGHITFGCFNNLLKLNDGVLDAWARILHALPSSRLLLKADSIADVAARDALHRRIEARGIAPARLVIEPWSSRADYLATYNRIDIALDPFPYPGGTTTCEALWMGVPVLTRRGDRFLAHAGESFLTNAGLPGWIAADDDDYVSRALSFAADLDLLAALRLRLRAQLLASPLCDAPRFARHFGQAMLAMWAQHQQATAHDAAQFDVAATAAEAVALHQSGAIAEAARRYRLILEHDPDHADSHHLLGHIELHQGNREAALEHIDRAIALRPVIAKFHNTRGTALGDEARIHEALASFGRAIELDPGLALAHQNRGLLLHKLGQTEPAVDAFARATELNPALLDTHHILLFNHNFLLKGSPAELRRMAERYGAEVTKLANPFTTWPRPETAAPLRVGLVSGDLRTHPVGFFVESLLRAANPARIVFIAFTTTTDEDALTQRLKPLFAEWHALHGRNDAEAAGLIHSRVVQVLIDLSGHTGGNRLPVFAWRPAPVQATWLGYFATTGVAEIDHIIGDPQVTPQNEAAHFTETIWPLPETYLCFTPPEHDVPVSPLPALASGIVTFGCFNNLTKINDAVLVVWARIMAAVPGSRLLMKAHRAADPATHDLVRARLVAHGIAAERLVLDPWSSRDTYLAAYHQVDIALDPFPYPGGATTCEALWMGVPVLTRQGARFLSHAGETFLANAGLPGRIAADDDDYVAKAVHFAADPAALATLRARLRAQLLASPLCDAPRFARHFELAMAGMWARFVAGQGGPPPSDPPIDTDATLREAIALHRSGSLGEALLRYRQILAYNPDHADSHHLIGRIAMDARQPAAALAHVERAIALQPSAAEFHNTMGKILGDSGHPAEAVAHFGRAIALQPELAAPHHNLLFCKNYLPGVSADELRADAERYGALVTRKARPYTGWSPPAETAPIRVGLVSGDLRSHPVGFFLEALLRAADPRRVVFVAFPCNAAEDDITRRIQPLCAEWLPLHGLGDEAAAARIHAAGIHILLDLAGHTGNNRLAVFAWRPAPVQAAWLGYFATTGLAEIDYIIGDPHVTPPGEAGHFTETVWPLPETYLCFTPPAIEVALAPPPSLASGRVTFGCFNHINKINDAVIALWSRLLLAIPGSRLLLTSLDATSSPLDVLRARFAAYGLPPDRLLVGPHLPRDAYLASYNEIDIALDPFPYPGGATTCEALWMGVPVLTRKGDRFLSHAGETFLINAGLPEWIAHDDDDYVVKAIHHASHLDDLARLRQRLRAQLLASPLCNASRFARQFEHAMAAMWARCRERHEQCHQPGAAAPARALAALTAGNALLVRDALPEAVARFQDAIAIDPACAEAHNNQGIALAQMGRLDAAAEAFRQATIVQPAYPEAHSNRGRALLELGRPEDAAASCRHALALDPACVSAHFNLGNVFSACARWPDAAACFRRAIELAPNHADAHNNLGHALKEQGLPEQAIACHARALAIDPANLLAYNNLLFCQNYLRDRSPAPHLDIARGFGSLVSSMVQHPFTTWHTRQPGQALRIGLVSGDLRDHPVGRFLEPLLRAVDPGRLTFLAFPTQPGGDALTTRIRPLCAAWHPIHGCSDAAAAALIHAAAPDVLIDLAGHTAHNRLPVFAWRPARVQATWLGYFATTGVTEIDAIIADPHVAPASEAGHFTERVCRLPETYLCYSPPLEDIPVAPLPALETGTVTFGCFNDIAKVNDSVVALWRRILDAVPHSRLMLKAKQFSDPASRDAIRARFAALALASDRLVIDPPSPRADYLRAHHAVDIMLDPFPYPGGTTSCEALWMGVPVLTRRGDRFLARAGETILANAGLTEWIAVDDEDYLARATRFATDLSQLSTLRAGLRAQVLASPLFDAPRFAGHFTDAMEGLARGC